MSADRNRGYFIDYLIERVDVRDFWAQHVEHEFVMKLAKGTLEIDRFNHYLVQDYLFLVSLLLTEPSNDN